MKCENLRRALYAYPHPEPNSLRPRKKEKICAFRFASFVPNERPGGGGLVALTVRGVSAEWLRAGVPPLLRGADGSPQSTPEGFPPEKGSAQWT